MVAPIQGLTSEQVLERRRQGLGNRVPAKTSRTYLQILLENVFTFVNNVLFGLGIALAALGKPREALMSVGVILVNVVVSLTQEIRAKRTLDRIALLTRPKATVIRDGREQSVDPDEIVVGDILAVRPGDQIVVDGQVVGPGQMDVDESLLTGESDLIAKGSGDPVYSGSFCVTGAALYEAQKVGSASLAHQITAGARAFRRILTPLQRQVNTVIRVILFISIYFEILLVVDALVSRTSFLESVRQSIVIIGLVPNGLLLAISVAYALAAVRIAGRGALPQQINAIESLSHVDTLCLDKTGTLTTNRLQFHAARPIGSDEEELLRLLGTYAASTPAGNRTTAALAAACPGEARPVVDEVPFSSARRWSALALAGPPGLLVLGAPEALRPAMRLSESLAAEIEAQANAWADQGLRVVLLAHHPAAPPLHDQAGQPILPSGLLPLGLVAFSHELRPDVRETLAGFAQAGVELKIISGDSPRTVEALARQAGFADSRALSGAELESLDDAHFAQAVLQTNIFGRISPQQKQKIVQALRSQGRYVAMVGDGVNDVLSLKQSNLGIALQSGSQATRSVADIVLLNDSFAVLPSVVREGQRIINGMQDILKLFMVRVSYVALLILSTGFFGAFPFVPTQMAVLVFFNLGLPSLALAAWASPSPLPPGGMMRRLLHFFVPAVLTMGILGLGVFAGYLVWGPQIAVPPNSAYTAEAVAQTALTIFSILCGLLLIPYVEPPTDFWVGGDVLSGDWRPSALAGGLIVACLVLALTPGLNQFFELLPLQPLGYLPIAAAVVLWTFLVRLVWRTRLMDRFFGADLGFRGSPGADSVV